MAKSNPILTELRAAVKGLLEKHGREAGGADLYLFHQANLNLLRQLGRSLGAPPERVFVNLDRYGNTSAASVLIAAAEAQAAGRLPAGSTAVLAAFGAGFSYGAILLRAA